MYNAVNRFGQVSAISRAANLLFFVLMHLNFLIHFLQDRTPGTTVSILHMGIVFLQQHGGFFGTRAKVGRRHILVMLLGLIKFFFLLQSS